MKLIRRDAGEGRKLLSRDASEAAVRQAADDVWAVAHAVARSRAAATIALDNVLLPRLSAAMRTTTRARADLITAAARAASAARFTHRRPPRPAPAHGADAPAPDESRDVAIAFSQQLPWQMQAALWAVHVAGLSERVVRSRVGDKGVDLDECRLRLREAVARVCAAQLQHSCADHLHAVAARETGDRGRAADACRTCTDQRTIVDGATSRLAELRTPVPADVWSKWSVAAFRALPGGDLPEPVLSEPAAPATPTPAPAPAPMPPPPPATPGAPTGDLPLATEALPPPLPMSIEEQPPALPVTPAPVEHMTTHRLPRTQVVRITSAPPIRTVSFPLRSPSGESDADGAPA